MNLAEQMKIQRMYDQQAREKAKRKPTQPADAEPQTPRRGRPPKPKTANM